MRIILIWLNNKWMHNSKRTMRNNSTVIEWKEREQPWHNTHTHTPSLIALNGFSLLFFSSSSLWHSCVCALWIALHVVYALLRMYSTDNMSVSVHTDAMHWKLKVRDVFSLLWSIFLCIGLLAVLLLLWFIMLSSLCLHARCFTVFL